jgi:ELWxxDGT repeat protein
MPRGTSAQRITDLDNGPESSLNDDVTGFPGPSGDFLFVAETGDLGMELWRTDGTLGGTLRLTDVTEPRLVVSTLSDPRGGEGWHASSTWARPPRSW